MSDNKNQSTYLYCTHINNETYQVKWCMEKHITHIYIDNSWHYVGIALNTDIAISISEDYLKSNQLSSLIDFPFSDTFF